MDEKWRKGAWDSSEDEILCQAVKEYGCRWADPVTLHRGQMLIGLWEQLD